MRTAIDTNVISALWSGEPASQGMAALLGGAKNRGGLVICAPVYVELHSRSARDLEGRSFAYSGRGALPSRVPQARHGTAAARRKKPIKRGMRRVLAEEPIFFLS
jgi:predicted nucleic acid-binding protein